MRRALALGLRLGWPRRRDELARMLLAVLASMLAAFAVLSLLAIPRVVDGQATRLAGQSVDWIGGSSIEEWSAKSPIRASRTEEYLNDRTLTRIAVGAVSAEADMPPWLERYPDPGELVASSALVDLIADDPGGAGLRFPQPVVQQLPDEALIAPDQLLAIVGVGDSELQSFGVGGPARRIGVDDAVHQGPARGVIRVLVAAGAIFAGLPAIILSISAARLSARVRERRLAALRLMGLTPATVGFVNAVEIVLATIAGVFVGTGLWLAVRESWATAHLGPTHWFSGDATLSGLELVGTAISIVLIGAIASTVASHRSLLSPLDERNSAPPDRLRRWLRFSVLAIGVALLVICCLWTRPTTTWFATFAAGNIVAGLGLYLALPVVATATGTILARATTHPALALAGRRLRFEPTAVARTTAAVLALVLVIGFAQVLIGVLDWATARNLQSLNADVPVLVELQNAGLDSSDFDIPGVQRALPLIRLDLADGDFAKAIVGECAELAPLATTTPIGCDDSVAQPFFGAPQVPGLEIGTSVEMVITAQNGATSAPAELRLHPDLVPTGAASPRDWLVELESIRANDTLVDHVVAKAPAAGFGGPPSPDRGRQLATYDTLVTAATVCALVLLSAAATIAVVDRTIERRRTANQLLALGLPASTLRATEGLAVAAPLLAGVVMATIVAALSGMAYFRLGFNEFTYPFTEIAVAFGAGLVAAAIVAAAAATTTPTRLSGRIESDA